MKVPLQLNYGRWEHYELIYLFFDDQHFFFWSFAVNQMINYLLI